MLLFEMIHQGRPVEHSMTQRALALLPFGTNTVYALCSVSGGLIAVDIEFRNRQLLLARVTEFCGIREVSVVVV